MDNAVEKKVIDYVVKHYKKMFEKVQPIVSENETVFMVLAHKDGSPLMLSKEILNK
tara:strand:+ start:1609 stop:1776 length:168 start_codon:yes stop_codon:yes gene_type:complete